MIGGIALIGVVTATVASLLIDRVRDVEESHDTGDTNELRTEIQGLRDEISALH